MHHSSMLRMEWFVNQFLANEGRRLSVLDIGSYDVNGTYKQYFDPSKFEYVGLDMEKGPNVDVVPASPYVWNEIGDDTYDVVISGQALEHIEFFWITVSEMTRVLKKDGILCIIAPNGFPEHRFPVDCWRFFSDGMIALARYFNLEVLHAHTNCAPSLDDVWWYSDTCADSMLVARKPYSGKPVLVNLEEYKCTPADQQLFRQNMVPAAPAAPTVAPLTEAASAYSSWQSILSGETLPENDPISAAGKCWVPVPSKALREFSSVGDLSLWYSIGECWSQIATKFSRTPAPLVVDLGCGCGSVARFFAMNPLVQYIGIDTSKPTIDWCAAAFASFPQFKFIHLDVRSQLYNPNGVISSEAAVMPVNSNSADIIICGSLFAHLREQAFRHHMNELRRCLSWRGRAVVSILNKPDNGRFSGDEHRTDISDSYFCEIVAQSGLSVVEHVGNVFGPEVYILEPA